MRRAFVYRLYPTPAQRKRLDSVRETCRRWYNTCLAERIEAWDEYSVGISYYDQQRGVKILKRENPFAKTVHTHCLQGATKDLDLAFKAFFRRCKSGEAPGYPRFKARHRFAGFGFQEYGNGAKVDGRRLRIFGVGRLAVRWHREMQGTPKTVRIVRKADGWYAAFSCEVPLPVPLPPSGETVGLDLGITHLVATSDG